MQEERIMHSSSRQEERWIYPFCLAFIIAMLISPTYSELGLKQSDNCRTIFSGF